MRYMSYTFKNIKNFIFHHPVMFVFLAVVQIICCTAIFITCGMVNNLYYTESEKVNWLERTFSFSFEDNHYNSYAIWQYGSIEDGNYEAYYVTLDPSTGEILEKTETMEHKYCIPIKEARAKIKELSSFLKSYDDLDCVQIRVLPNRVTNLNETPGMVEVYSTVPGIGLPESDIYLDSSEKVIFAPVGGPFCQYKLGDIVNINGFDYKIVKQSNLYRIPYNALDDNFVVQMIQIIFNEPMSESTINEITAYVNALFGLNIQDSSAPKPYDPMEKQLNEMVYIISIAVMIIILLSISKFYSYILSDRKESLTILRLCGGTRGKIHIIYMFEIFITMIVTSAIGFCIFRFLLFDGIAYSYPSFKEFYTTEIYITVLAAYIIIAMLIMSLTVIPATKVTVADMKRRV